MVKSGLLHAFQTSLRERRNDIHAVFGGCTFVFNSNYTLVGLS